MTNSSIAEVVAALVETDPIARARPPQAAQNESKRRVSAGPVGGRTWEGTVDRRRIIVGYA